MTDKTKKPIEPGTKIKKTPNSKPEYIQLSNIRKATWMDITPPVKVGAKAAKNTHNRYRLIPTGQRIPSMRTSNGRWGYVVVTIWTLLFGFLSYDLTAGQWMVALSGIVILLLKLDSRYSFFSSLCLLILVPIFIISNRPALADNYAVYSYFFLVFGTIAAVRELRRENR